MKYIDDIIRAQLFKSPLFKFSLGKVDFIVCYEPHLKVGAIIIRLSFRIDHTVT